MYRPRPTARSMWAPVSALVAGCVMGAPPGGEPSSDASVPAEDAGSVALHLSMPGGETIGSVTFRLSNGSNTYAGTAQAGTMSALDFVIGGVAAGGGYALLLSASSADGAVTCTGSYGTGVSDAGQDNGPPFSVATRQSAFVTVQMICVKN